WRTDDESYSESIGKAEAGKFGVPSRVESGNRQLILTGSHFYSCTFEDCTLPGTDFSDALLELTKIKGTNKNSATLNGSSFEGAYLKYTDFINVNLSGTLMTKVRLENCDFESSVLAGASLVEAELTGCTFGEDCNFNGTSFKNARLTGVNFNGANLTNADLSGCTTRGLKGKVPLLPEDCQIKFDLKINRDTAGVATDTLTLGTYSIVVNAGRFSNGVREKGN
ncbi:MAG: pentapeptide repeat-containing protein, partial [Flavobacteriales bacterium]